MQGCPKEADDFNQFQYHKASICPVVGIPIEQQLACAKKARKHFLKFFLDVSYYLCVIPFKIVDAADGSYKKKSFVLQQVIL